MTPSFNVCVFAKVLKVLRAKCVDYDELVEAVQLRAASRQGFADLWMMLGFTVVLCICVLISQASPFFVVFGWLLARVTPGGKQLRDLPCCVFLTLSQGQPTHLVGTQRCLLNSLAYNDTQSWMAIKDQWDFLNWYDSVMGPVLFSDVTNIKIASTGSNYTFEDFNKIFASSRRRARRSPPTKKASRRSFLDGSTITHWLDYEVKSPKMICDWMQALGNIRLRFYKRDTDLCNTAFTAAAGWPYDPTHCVKKDTASTTLTTVTFPTAMNLADVSGFKRDALLPQLEMFAGTISFDIVTYNANTHMLAYLDLKAVVDTSGHWDMSIGRIGALNAEKDKDGAITGWYWFFYAVFILGTLLLTFRMFYDIMAGAFFADPWNVTDFLCLGMSWAYIGISIKVQVLLSDLHVYGSQYWIFQMGVADVPVGTFPTLIDDAIAVIVDDLSYAYLFQVFTSLLILLFFMRLMRYVKFEGRIGLITRMLVASALDMAHFIVFLGVYMAAFACCTMAVFGQSWHFLNTFNSSLEALFLLSFAAGPILDNYSAMCDINPIMAPLVVTIYLIMTALIMLNVFVAIIMDAYAEVKPDPKMQATLAEEAAEGLERRYRKITGGEDRADLDDLLEVLGTWEFPEDGGSRKISYASLKKKLGRPLTQRTDELVRGHDELLGELSYERIYPSKLDAKVAPEPDAVNIPVKPSVATEAKAQPDDTTEKGQGDSGVGQQQ